MNPAEPVEQRVSPSNDAAPRGALLEVAGLFTKLGFTAFGGPAAHVALMEDEVVTRRKWLDRTHFLDLVSAINFIPGPNSTELAIHIGYLRAGFAGLVTAGFCFIVPAVLIILPIAWAYVEYGTLPRAAGAMRLIGCAIVAIVAVAAWRFAAPLAGRPFEAAVGMLSAAAAWVLGRWSGLQPELIVLALAAVAGLLWTARPRTALRLPMLSIAPLPLAALPATADAAAFWRGMADLCLFLLKVGATLFGSGYVLVSYLNSGLVAEHGWMTERQLLDAVAVGQFTPGPLLTTATFAGYVLGHTQFAGGHVGGVVGAVLATAAIFLPSFVFVALLGPVLQRIRQNRWARGALDGMNAAVAGLLVVVTARLAVSAVQEAGSEGVAVLVGSVAALAMRVNATWVILVAAVAGWLLRGG